MQLIVNQLAIEYQDRGAGPVLLLLHGWQDNLRTFDPLVNELSNKWRIIRLDLPGFGGSQPPSTAWHIDDYVAFVQAFVLKLGLEIDCLIGHSLGGRIAIKAVATGALKPRRLVLIASAGLAKTNSPRNQAYRLAAKTGKVITLVPPLSFWRKSLRRRLYQSAGSDYLDAGPLQATFLNVIAEDLQASAAAIACPTLLIWGHNDTQTPLADGQKLHQLIPHSTFKVVDHASHFVHQEQAPKVAQFIAEFLV